MSAKKLIKAKVTAQELFLAEQKAGLEMEQIAPMKYEVYKKGQCVFAGSFSASCKYVLDAAMLVENGQKPKEENISKNE